MNGRAVRIWNGETRLGVLLGIPNMDGTLWNLNDKKSSTAHGCARSCLSFHE
jgi:hypothetical protein